MVRKLVSVLSHAVLAAGVVVLLFVAYQVWVTDWASDREQERIADDLRHDWTAPVPPLEQPEFGEAFAFLHIPSFGPGWEPRAVVEGTDPEELADGPGHYVHSAMPGEPGNFAMAGHRVGLGSPFLDLDRLRPGDAVLVETADSWFTYRVTGAEVVHPSDVSVVAPVPGGPMDAEPRGAFLTMTTCNPKFSNRERLVVHAELRSALSKADAPSGPPALREV
ncbi:class E sortase [Blastococcus litoris]|uniref:class E sortase n=1 Tax=Blastococcus litoris TaxID=2171622 RepID=UPI001F13BB8C|nr:class E sortase [Blastococcus litoris]